MDVHDQFRTGQSPDEVLAAYRKIAESFGWMILDPGSHANRLTAVEGITWRSWKQEITVRADASKTAAALSMSPAQMINSPKERRRKAFSESATR